MKFKKIVASMLSAAMMLTAVPLQSVSNLFGNTVITASAATQTVTKTVKFDMDGGQSGTTAKIDDYNLYSTSAGTLHWSCDQPNINYILYSYL